MMNFEHSDLCVGIDLGTTNSAISTCRVRDNGQLFATVTQTERIVGMTSNGMIKERYNVLPSCVYYKKDSSGKYTPIVGEFAKEHYKVRPDTVAKSIKLQMGRADIDYPNWDENIPDKTPHEVSARILSHLLREFKARHRVDKVEDAVITVPASFGFEKRQATLLAAEKAGLKVRDENGEFRKDILLSEPEAVIYNLITEIQNGQVDIGIDFDRAKNVLVYDVGGGTLDITVHKIQKVPGTEVVSMKCLGTNEYTPIAGDRFDELLAERIYNDYIGYYSRQSEDVAQTLKRDKSLKAKLLKCAEELKIKVSDFCQYGLVDDDEIFDFQVNVNNGFFYSGDITKEEFEECLAPVMGNGLCYEDYKNADKLTDKDNIIYPVLCVLKQIYEKYGDVKIDAVVLNGGLSKLYMIDERLTKLFGFKTVALSDPDLSVAKGASIWHYYLHQQSTSDVIKRLHEELVENYNGRMIVSENAVLPQSLYLGMKGGAKEVIAHAGCDLPLENSDIRGRIAAGQKEVCLSVMEQRGINGYAQIASGFLSLKRDYARDVFAGLKFDISKDMILSVYAEIFADEQGTCLIERTGKAQILLGEICKGKTEKLLPPAGAKLMVKNEMQNFITACENYAAMKNRNTVRAEKYLSEIKKAGERMTEAGNGADFASEIIKTLETTRYEEVLFNLIPVADIMADRWAEKDKKQLVRVMRGIIKSAKVKYSLGNAEFQFIGIVNKAIHLMGKHGAESDLAELEFLLAYKKHKAFVLCAYSNQGYKSEVVCNEFLKSRYSDEGTYGMLWAVGNCLRKAGCDHKISELKIVEKIAALIESGQLKPKELWCAETTLGLICDRREETENCVLPKVAEKAQNVLEAIDAYYPQEVSCSSVQVKTLAIAKKLIAGEMLDGEEEEYLKKISDGLLFGPSDKHSQN